MDSAFEISKKKTTEKGDGTWKTTTTVNQEYIASPIASFFIFVSALAYLAVLCAGATEIGIATYAGLVAAITHFPAFGAAVAAGMIAFAGFIYVSSFIGKILGCTILHFFGTKTTETTREPQGPTIPRTTAENKVVMSRDETLKFQTDKGSGN